MPPPPARQRLHTRPAIVAAIALVLALALDPSPPAGARGAVPRARGAQLRHRLPADPRDPRRHHRRHRHRRAPAPPAATAPAAAGQPGTRTASPRPAGPVAMRLPAVGVAAGADMQAWPAASVARELDAYPALHATWIRHDFAWDAIEPKPGVYAWAGFDQLVSAARSRNINVIATLGYTPAWANGGYADHRYAPSSPSAFAEYAGVLAGRYSRQGVHVYEIWNEPNIGFWQPAPDPAAYATLLCAAYRTIHAADPAAVVLDGGTSPAGDGPTSYSPQTWLSDLYANGAGGCFDAVAMHPYIDSSSTPGTLGNAWDLMADAYPPSNLRAIMAANGDAAKRIWATEVGCDATSLGESECANRIADAFAQWRSFAWAGVLCWFTYWDPNAYGLVDGSWNPRPEWYAFQRAAAGL